MLAVTVRYSVVQRGERVRLLANQTVLLTQAREYRVRDSLHAVSVGVLTMRADELRRGFDEMSTLVRDMNINLRRVETLSQTALESNYSITAAVRDTVVYQIITDTLTSPRTAQTVRFRNAHISLDGLLSDSVFHGSVVTYDTITQALHRIPHRFLFLRWGTKELRQDIVSSNPHTRITYNRTIKVKR